MAIFLFLWIVSLISLLFAEVGARVQLGTQSITDQASASQGLRLGLDIPELAPNVYSLGSYFASSGFDSTTNATSGFAGILSSDGIAFPNLTHLSSPSVALLQLDINQDNEGRQTTHPEGEQQSKPNTEATHPDNNNHNNNIPHPLFAANDILYLESFLGFGEVHLLITFKEWHTLWGLSAFLPQLNPLGALRVINQGGCSTIDALGYSYSLHIRELSESLAKKFYLFGFSYGDSISEACGRATSSFGLKDLKRLAERRLQFFSPGSLSPSVVPQEWRPLTGKCLAVIKVDTLAPEGAVLSSNLWSTPDRLPHRFMWLWDSVFHSIGMLHIHPNVAAELLSSVIAEQTDEGLLSIQMLPSGPQNLEMTQPPILAWGVWEVFSKTRDLQWLRSMYPKLVKYILWDMKHRDSNQNLLLEWKVKPWREFCKCAESGMDNSPRFDSGQVLDTVDFSVFIAHDIRHLAKIASELGLQHEAEQHNSLSKDITAAIHSQLWDENLGFYFDRPVDPSSNTSAEWGLAEFRQVFASSGLLTLMLEPTSFPHGRVPKLVQALTSESHFWTDMPVPSVSVSDQAWDTDMWRGPAWANVNYLIHMALLKHGYKEEANELANRHLKVMRKVYERTGALWESYDSKNAVLPNKLKKKGKPVGAVCDLQWTASVTLSFLYQQVFTASSDDDSGSTIAHRLNEHELQDTH